jgi:phytol kinase
LLLGMLLTLRFLQPRLAIAPEHSRKIAHVGLGLATLSFPFLFHEMWPVVVLVAVTVGVLAAMRWVEPVRSRFGSVVDGVERRTGGGLYFPIAAGLLFLITKGDPVLFGIPILTLTFADAAAALIGVQYGRIRIRTGVEAKTLEGSVAFFTTAFLTTHIPILLFTNTGRVESLLIGIIFGVVVMMMEAVSLRGLDNFFIPFGGYLLLDSFLQKNAYELTTALVVIILLLSLVLLLRKQRTLSDTAMLAGVLAGFVAWTAGGWKWVVPMLVLFLTYTILWPRRRLVLERPHELFAVLAVVSSGMLWLVLAFVLKLGELYYPYTISFAAHMCFIGITWYRMVEPEQSAMVAVVRSSVTSWLALFIPYALILRGSPTVLLEAGAALVWLLAGSLAFTWLVPYEQGAPTRWVRHSLVGLAASALGLLLVPFPESLQW